MLFYITLSNGSCSEYHKNFFLKEQSVSTSVQSFQFYASYLFLYFGEALLLSLNCLFKVQYLCCHTLLLSIVTLGILCAFLFKKGYSARLLRCIFLPFYKQLTCLGALEVCKYGVVGGIVKDKEKISLGAIIGCIVLQQSVLLTCFSYCLSIALCLLD